MARDYFDGYRASAPHPMMTSTGSEGRCDICGRTVTRDHARPWTRVAPQFVPDPVPEPSFIGEPYDVPPLGPRGSGTLPS